MSFTRVWLLIQTYMMLSDTCTKIDDLERELWSHEATMRESPSNASVAAQLGKTYIITHNYTKAIEQHRCALQNTEDTLEKLAWSYDLADLYFKLRDYEQAERVLSDMLESADVNIQMQNMENKMAILLCLKGSLLLSKVQHLLGKHGILGEESRRSSPDSRYLPQYKVMFNAKNIQSWLLREQHGQHTDSIREQRNVAADIYFHFAQVCEIENDPEKTMILLKEALNCNAAHNLATLALAKIQLSRGDVTECEHKFEEILRADPFDSEAADTLVQLILYRELYESAILHFKKILERDPNHYPSIAQLIRLLHCAGQMDDAQHYVVKAEKASLTTYANAGLYFCKGLMAYFFNNHFEALQMLNHARADAEWGKLAIYSLIEVYLNMDIKEQVQGEEILDGNVGSNEEGIKAAWKLLGESRLLDGKSVKQLVLECYATMATRQKEDIEFALGRLSEALVEEEQRVPILLAVAIARTLLNQAAKAKTQLQVIDRLVYKWHDGEDFERAWLMLAGIHMQSGKHDAVEELCRKCLRHNKDCDQAWACLGLTKETGYSLNEVATCLENASKCHKETSSAMGYHLAITYLKQKRYIEAIVVCQKVLKTSNNHPQIKKEVLDKARLCVRV
ncbi:unnamed protein product [Calypogeia fissa]